MSTRADLTITLAARPTQRRARRNDAPRLLVMADFAAAQAEPTFATQRLTAEDIDATVAKLAPVVHVTDSRRPPQAVAN